MSTRVRTACLCAALLVPMYASAKPPELPLQEKDQCMEHRPGALPYDPAEEASAQDSEPAAVIDMVSPIGGCWLLKRFTSAISDTLSCWYASLTEALACGGAMRAPNTDVPAKSTPKTSATTAPTCPYLRWKSAQAAAVIDQPDALRQSVVNNLDKLEQARQSYLRAEGYRKIRQPDAASLYYEKAKFLCPGSRFDYLATAPLRAIYAGTAMGSAEESEEPSPSPPRGGRDLSKRVEEQVAELLEACQRAYTDGRYREAAELARQALKLDPDCIAARALTAKTRRIIQRLEKRPAN